MPCIVNLQNLNFRYPGGLANTLQSLSLQVHKGESVALLGRNGSGKSTLMKLLSRRLPMPVDTFTTPRQTSVVLFSQNLDRDLFMDLTLAENITLFGITFSSDHEKSSYLAAYHPQLPKRLDIPVKKLSGGERQAFLLALTLYNAPQLVLMDEPTSAMDIVAQEKLMNRAVQKIKARQSTLVLCTHNLDIAQRYTDRIVALKNGQIVLDQATSTPLTATQIKMIYE